VTQNDNKNKLSDKEQVGKKCEKDISRTVETPISSITKTGCENETEKYSHEDNTGQQLLDQSFISVEFDISNDSIGMGKELENKNTSPAEEDKTSSVIENNLGNDGEKSKEVNDEIEGVQVKDFESQKLESGIQDLDTGDVSKVKQDEIGGILESRSEQSEFYSDIEDSKNNDIVSKNIESLLQLAPKATSTPYTGKGKASTSSKDRDYGEASCGKDSTGATRNACEAQESLILKDEKVDQEKGDFMKKEPVEDECVGEEVIIGAMYTAEDSMSGKEDNIAESIKHGLLDTERDAGKIPSLSEPTETTSILGARDSIEDDFKVTGAIAEAYSFIMKEGELSAFPKESLKAETVAVQENENKGESSVQVQSLLKVGASI
jgi:hypothetical protein